MIPSIDSQIMAMRVAWPTLRAERLDERRARWRGALRPLMQTYEVEIAYRVPYVIERIDPLRQQPIIHVVDPPLKRRRSDAEGSLPHVYWDDPNRPALCLFDHETQEWTPFHLLADTTVPWIIDWIVCYEGWRATGEWAGGGRHASTISN